QSQAKDTVILKLKEKLQSLNGDVKKRKVKKEIEEIETLNIELDHRVTKLVAENEHFKQKYKQLYDSIKPSHVRSKQQCDDLIKQVNLKSAKIFDLNASLQEKVLVITALKESLSKLKGKNVVNEVVPLHYIDPELLKIDVAPLALKLRKNRTVHTDYIRHPLKEAATLREIVESKRLINPLNTSFDYASKYTKRIQELLNILQKTCPCITDLGSKLVAETPKNKNKHIRFTEQIHKSGKITAKTTPYTNIVSNTPVLSSTGVNLLSSASGSKSQDNRKNYRIQRTPRKAKQNKLEEHLRKVVQIVLWYLDSGCSKHMTGDRSQLINYVHKFLGTVKFRNNHVAKIMGYGQFCDSDLEVAFCQHTCFICNLDGVDLLTGSRGNNLYTPSLQDMMASSPICLLSKASKTKSWLWHRRLSHLNFGAINHLARQGLVRGLLKLKFKKDHLYSACAMGKSMKKSHKPKSEDTNQEKLYLLHMDLCGPMRVESVNGKKYILVIADDYSRFTWVKLLRSKDEALDFIINENLGKLQPKADIGIFIGYAPTKKAFRIYNRRTRKFIETLHVDFDELTTMASEHRSSGPALHEMTPVTISSGLVQKSSSSTPFVPPSRNDWDLLFQPMFDELLNPPPSVDHQAA
nr:hypothetical protein [Tanacetum cinerariifolium]